MTWVFVLRLLSLSVRQGHGQRNPELFANAAGDVTVTSDVFSNQHVAGVKAFLGAVGNFKLSYPGQVQHVLTPGGGVVVGKRRRGTAVQVYLAFADFVHYLSK